MAILLMEGFDIYNDVSDFYATGWLTTSGSDPQMPANGGAFGGGAMAWPGTFGGSGVQKPIPFANATTYFVSFYYKPTSLPPANSYSVMAIYTGGGTRLFTISLTSTGSLLVTDTANTTYAPQLTGVLTGNVYYHVEVKFRLGTSNTDGTMEVRVDGTPVNTITGANFFNAAGGAALRLTSPGSTSYSIGAAFDDLVVHDNTGDANNDWLGGVRIDTLRPNADTAQADFSPSAGPDGYAMIDDPLGASDNNGTYVESHTVGAKSEFELSNLIGGSTGIMAVQPRVKSSKSDAGTRTYRAYIKDGEAVANGNTITPATGWAWASNGLFEVSPETAAAWTDADIAALGLGIEIMS